MKWNVFLFPVHLSSVGFIISPAARTQGRRGENFLSPMMLMKWLWKILRVGLWPEEPTLWLEGRNFGPTPQLQRGSRDWALSSISSDWDRWGKSVVPEEWSFPETPKGQAWRWLKRARCPQRVWELFAPSPFHATWLFLSRFLYIKAVI